MRRRNASFLSESFFDGGAEGSMFNRFLMMILVCWLMVSTNFVLALYYRKGKKGPMKKWSKTTCFMLVMSSVFCPFSVLEVEEIERNGY